MPLTFLNGGAPNYSGQVVSTAIDLIDRIDQTLTSAGWVSIEKTQGSKTFLRGTSLTNNHNCWVEFSIDSSYLHVRGWLEASRTNPTSMASPLTQTISQGTFCRISLNTENRLWITANQDAGCICIIPNSAPSYGVHFGFLDRIDPTDQWAWMVGNIGLPSNQSVGFAYSAKSKYDSTNWRAITTDMSVSRQWGAYDATWAEDLTGRRNFDGSCLIRPYYWLEGRVSTSPVATPPNNPHFRGNVQYAYTGMASTSAGTFGTDPVSGFRFMSVGDTGIQAMRIA